jgi:hypothetical protein
MPHHQQLMRNSDFTLSIAHLCTRFLQQQVEAEMSTHQRKGKKIGKRPKANSSRKGGKGGKGAFMESPSNLDLSVPPRQ